MVIRRLFLALFTTLSMLWLGVSDAVIFEVEVHGERAVAQQPIEGFARVHHGEAEEVDIRSFRLENKPLAVEFVHDSLHSSVSIIGTTRREERSVCSLYRFYLPGVPPGEYVLPPVSVVVGNRRYVSETAPYFVYGAATSEGFRLKALVRDPLPLYPGQTTEFVYRLSFSRPIEALVQTLPLIEAAGFRKIGEPKVTYLSQGDLTIQEISQEVQAISPGTFSFGLSTVEGHSYQRDLFGRRIYDKERLRAEAEGPEVVVAPFPQGPSDFRGALGDFQVTGTLLGPSQVTVGDRLQVELTITGEGVVSTIHAPDLTADRRFQRDFRLSDLPPEACEIPGGRRFVVEMRPVTAAVSSIPPIPFSSFDPQRRSFIQSSTKAIPIQVSTLPTMEEGQGQSGHTAPTYEGEFSEQTIDQAAGAFLMEIAGCVPIEIESLDREVPWEGLWLFPLLGLTWAIQIYFRHLRLTRRTRSDVLSGKELFRQARNFWDMDRCRSLRDLQAAFLVRLYEMGHVSDVTALEALGCQGPQGRVRDFLHAVQACYYGQAAVPDGKEGLFKEAEGLWADL